MLLRDVKENTGGDGTIWLGRQRIETETEAELVERLSVSVSVSVSNPVSLTTSRVTMQQIYLFLPVAMFVVHILVERPLW